MNKYDKKIEFNIKTHNKVYKRYEKNHGEIYNSIEQKRLREELSFALGQVKLGGDSIKCLDYGCGAGNLTHHMLALNNRNLITLADVSENFLKLVRDRFKEDAGRLSFVKLNGEDISNIPDNEFDFIATYSVLHHIPDYLKTINEFCRILKPGGVVYIDHELSPDFWNKDKNYLEYRALVRKKRIEKERISRFLTIFSPKTWFCELKLIFNPRFRIEGDIHVFSDDYIEWFKIKKIFNEKKFKIIKESDYLLYRRYCPKLFYEKYKNRCNDIRSLIVQKDK